MRMIIRTYEELISFSTFEDRLEYLQLDGFVGAETFGYERYLNQVFYKSREWRTIREKIILRDNGCDLGVDGYEIYGRILIHHMNPITAEDIRNRSDLLLDPNYLICVSHNTHNAITYGNKNCILKPVIERKKFDTCPWRH